MTNETMEVHDAEAVPAAVIHLAIPRDAMQTEFPRAIHEILDSLQRQGLTPAGPPFARHFRFDPEVFDFEVGFPVSSQVRPEGRMKPGELPAARVLRTIHHGSYDSIPEAWRTFDTRVKADRLDVGPEFRERYMVGPESGGPETWQTELSWVLR
ncbi:MAG: GyrI-like domain-containing protein [Gemmatimonadota bacterium]